MIGRLAFAILLLSATAASAQFSRFQAFILTPQLSSPPASATTTCNAIVTGTGTLFVSGNGNIFNSGC
jgi:hypothetical protein